MAIAHPELFARKSSGLIREFGVFDTFSFNVIGYALGLVLAITPFFAGALFPGANIFLILIIGTAFALFNGLVYSLLAGAMPRSGGEYVYNGRILHPAIGFMANWGFTWSQFLGIGIYTQWTVNYALAVSFATLGHGLGSKALLDAGIFIQKPWPSFIFGTCVLISVVLVLLAGTRFLRRFLNVFFVIATVGTLMTLFVFLGSSRDEFIAAFNAFMASTTDIKEDAYNVVIQLAKEKGWIPTAQTFGAVLLALPLGYWVYIGFTYSSYVGGEVKEPQKTQTYGIIGSLAFGFILYMIIMGAYYSVVGTEFNNAAAYLEYNTDANPLPVFGVLNFFAGVLTTNPIVLFFMGISFFLWFYLLLFVMVSICVRNMFAWSFDQIMPVALTKVTDKTRFPWAATIVVAILAWVLLWASIFTPLFDYIFNYIAIFAIAFWITSFAAMLLPFRKPELFQSAPDMVKRTVLGVPLITIAGVVNFVLFSLILYSSYTLPAFSGPVGPVAIGFVLGIYIVGLIIYYVVASIRKKQGVDLDLLYTEIPPE
ncbi:MAG: APC family permease [Gammaproteobacteria bacterium]|jgi:amino acid transporter|nr:APC family permease [Gammaproteobacteria bacterium]